MLQIENVDYFRKVYRFAQAKNLEAKLADQLWYLHNFGAVNAAGPRLRELDIDLLAPVDPFWRWAPFGKGTATTLYADYAPASFELVIEKAGRRWFNGGLIFHGDQSGWVKSCGTRIEPGQSVGTGSVAIGESDNPWRVHT